MTADAVGGVWQYSLNLARGLKAHGIETHIAVIGPAPSSAQREQARDLPLYDSPFALEWMNSPWDDVDASGKWLLSLERQLAPDLIHINGYSHGALSFRAPKVVVAHSCVCSWWRAVHGEPAPADWDEYRRRVTSGLLLADSVVAISAAMEQSLKEEYGVSAARVIYNGGVAHGHHQASAAHGRHQPGRYQAKATAVFCAGRFWDEAKNLRAIEKAAPEIAAEIFAAGDGWNSQWIWSLGILDRTEMDSWYDRCAVFCHPAMYEPFGLAPLEAGLAGCALVLGDIPSLREIWQNSAVFVDPRNPAKLAAAINELFENPCRLKRMSEVANQRALSFTHSRQAAEYAALYREHR